MALEERMAAGEQLTKDLAEKAFNWVNVNGSHDWIIADVLKDSWLYGKQLNQLFE